MSELHEWEKWGRQDPYFAVITDPRYRSANLTPESRKVFFDSGRVQAQSVLAACRQLIDPAFQPRRVLDFGCGVGRMLPAFAAGADAVVGVDVSQSMLDEARRNCIERGVANVELALADETLSALEGRFDLVHSCIVFQHIDIPAGRRLFARLVELLAPGGVAALHVTYGKAYHARRFGQPPVAATPAPKGKVGAGGGRQALKRVGRWVLGSASRSVVDALPERAQRLADPQMAMNPYNLSELAFLIQSAGVQRFHADFTDHGGELGVFLYFQKPVTG